MFTVKAFKGLETHGFAAGRWTFIHYDTPVICDVVDENDSSKEEESATFTFTDPVTGETTELFLGTTSRAFDRIVVDNIDNNRVESFSH